MNNFFSMQKLLFPIIVGFVVVASGSFYGGMRYQSSKTPTFVRGQVAGDGVLSGSQGGMRRNGMGGQGRGTGVGGFANGEVLSKDGTSFTLKLRDGGSKIVLYSTSTRVSKMADGSLDDVVAGAEVMMTGTPNQDGSMTALTVQVRPRQ